ncbi:ankyrin repeat domain-containing protein 66-like isoform X3 [Babylonia areolata]|uniref:ankyrin repeat domain-containing protein 66-like isoform X3 n=1 Tax=Babylonia areolata TaxID=304850 RepID=UPI003FD4C98E
MAQHLLRHALMSGAGLELHDAASTGDYDALEEYVRSGNYDVNLKDVDSGNRTALHWACQKGFAECSRLLLDHGAKGTARTTSGWTPAHCAAESNRISALRALHAALVPVDLKDKHGDTPRRIATIYGHRDCVRYLLQAEAEVAERRRKGLVTEEDNVYTDEDVDVI